MKKTYIIILTLILSLTFISIDTHAYDLYANDTPIDELNDLTLNEVFDTAFYSKTINPQNINTTYYDTTDISINGGDIFYVIGHFEIDSGTFEHLTFQPRPSTANVYITISDLTNKITTYSYDTILRIFYLNTNNLSGSLTYDIYNLTDLGIDNLTQSELDEWYDIYKDNLNEINEFNERSLSEIEIYLNSILTFGARYVYDPVLSILLYGILWFVIYKFLKGVIDYV